MFVTSVLINLGQIFAILVLGLVSVSVLVFLVFPHGHAEVFVPEQGSARAAELNLEPRVAERICVVFSRVHDLWESFQTKLGQDLNVTHRDSFLFVILCGEIARISNGANIPVVENHVPYSSFAINSVAATML